MGERDTTEEAAVISTAGESTITCLRSFGRHGIPTIVVSQEPGALAFHSRYCDESVVAPPPYENLIEYKNTLLSLARRDDVRTIVPMREEDVYVLSKYRSEFEDYVKPLYPSYDALRTAQDRVRLVQAAQAAGVPTPETQLLDDVDDWNRELIVKPRYSIITDGYDRSVSPEYFTEPPSTKYLEPGREPNREAIRAEMGHVPIVQEYVPGPEYAFWALYDRGTPVATCHKHQLRADSYAGGTSSYRKTVHDPQLEDVGRALLGHLDWHGLASVQFMKDTETGEFKLLEINPRIWLSVSCAVRAGVDFPYHYWQLAGGEPVLANSGYTLGVGTHNPIGEFTYLRSIVQDDLPSYVERPSLGAAVWEVTSSFCAQPNIGYFSIDDPAPFVFGLGSKVRNVISHLR